MSILYLYKQDEDMESCKAKKWKWRPATPTHQDTLKFFTIKVAVQNDPGSAKKNLAANPNHGSTNQDKVLYYSDNTENSAPNTDHCSTDHNVALDDP